MLSLVVSTTLAFHGPALAPQQRHSSIKMEKSEALPFAEKPAALDGTMVGDIGFDPLGFSSSFPLTWLREAELKHARVCMLAVLGYVAVDLGLRAPGAEKIGQVTSFTAHNACVTSGHMWFLLLVIGVLELVGIGALAATMNGNREPGDFALDGFGAKKDPELFKRYQMNELKNGRLAMLAFSGIVTQDALISGAKGFPYF